jgi:flagellar biosynthesis/type III secretory pathway protein FliH
VRAAGEAASAAGEATDDGRLKLAQRAEKLAALRRELDRREADLARRESELAEMQKALDDKLERLAGLIGSVQEEKTEMLEANEEEIVSFSLSITEKVLQCEIENGRYKIGEVVRSTLQAVRERGAMVVRVNPRDYEMAVASVEKLGRTYGTTHITCVPDESIPLASCCIETDAGKVFSEIPGRLKRIESSLLKRNGDADGV